MLNSFDRKPRTDKENSKRKESTKASPLHGKSCATVSLQEVDMIQGKWSPTLSVLFRGMVVFAVLFSSTLGFMTRSEANNWANTR